MFIIFKNGHLQVTYWIVVKFRSIIYCIKVKKQQSNKGLHNENVLIVFKLSMFRSGVLYLKKPESVIIHFFGCFNLHFINFVLSIITCTKDNF